MLGKIFLHLLIGLEDVNGEHDQSLVRKFFGNVIHQRGFAFAVFTPGGPELEEDYFAFDRRVVELVARGCLGAEARRGLAGLVARESAESDENECDRYEAAEGDHWRCHGAEYYH